MATPPIGTLLEIALRTTMVYVLLLVGVRITGKRQIGQLTPFDLVVLLLLSNAVQNAMTGPDTSVAGGATAAVTLLTLNYLVSRLRTLSPQISHLLEGQPVVLIEDGHINFINLKRENMTLDDLVQALREHEVDDPAHVVHATLEVDGTVSVIRTGDSPGQFVSTRHRLRRHTKRNQ